jgi:hypothetical protein
MSGILPTNVQSFLSGESEADARGECYRGPDLLIAELPNLKIFIHVFFDVNQDRKEAKDGEESDVVGSAQVAAMFTDWTDPLQLSQAM